MRGGDLAKVVDLNNAGIDMEKAGNLGEACSLYEKCLSIGYPAMHSFDRLMIIYSKLKKTEDEIRVIDAAIKVVVAENLRRLQRALAEHPTKKKEIEAAHQLNQGYRPGHWYLYSPYDVNNYLKRREKALMRLQKERG